MGKVKTTRDQQPTPVAPLLNSDKAAKGYPAITRFAQAPAPSTGGSNGLPHQLQQGVEALSGISMADTSVHYNSSAPAQIGALAYAAGNQIHLGPGQEQHLPHEAWHVVQQKQGRVKPTLQAKGLAVNDDQALETEADVMGQRAAQLKTTGGLPLISSALSVSQSAAVTQRKIGFEFQAVNSIFLEYALGNPLGEEKDKKFKVEIDGTKHELELVTKAVDETTKGRDALVDIMDAIATFLLSVENGGPIGRAENIAWRDDIVEKRKKYDLLFAQSEIKSGADKEKDFEEKVKREKLSRFSVHQTGKHFHPQATVGVKFENVINLIDHLTNAQIKNHYINKGKIDPAVTKPSTPGIKAVTKETKDVAMPAGGDAVPGEAKTERIRKVVPDIIREPQMAADIIGWGAKGYHTPYKEAWMPALTKVNSISALSPKVKGLATIFLGLAEGLTDKYAGTIRNVKVLKYMMPFMLRTGFMSFFNNLDAKEKEELKLIDTKDLDKKFPLLKIETTVKEVFEDMMESKADDKKKEDLLQIRGGHYGHGGIREDEASRKLYNIEDVTDIGISDTSPEVRRKGAIIELRKLGSMVPPEKLTEFALAVFDLIVLINAPEDSSSSSLSAINTTGEVEPAISEPITPAPTPSTHVPESATEPIPLEVTDIVQATVEMVGELLAEVPLPLVPTGPSQQGDAEAEPALPLPEPAAELLPPVAGTQPDGFPIGLDDTLLPPPPPPPA